MGKRDFIKIKELVIQNELDKAFDLMYGIIEEYEELNDIHKTLIIRHSEYNEIKSRNRKGIISYDDYQIVKRNILNVILDVADELGDFIQIKNKKETQQKEKRIKSIQNEMSKRIEENDNSNYVFLLGREGVGKTTFLASLNNYILSNRDLRSKIDLDTSNPKSIEYLNYAIRAIKTGQLIGPKHVGEVLEIDMSITDEKNRKFIPITFLEMPNEELEKFGLSEGNHEFSMKVEEYLNSSRMYIMITSVNTAHEDDYVFYNLIRHLKKQERDFKIGLFISKEDLSEEKEINQVEFVRNNMPYTYEVLNYRIAKPVMLSSFGISTLQNQSSDFYRKTTNWLMKELRTTPNTA